MPEKGQQAIVDAVTLHEKGLVMTEFSTYLVKGGMWKILSTIQLGRCIIGLGGDKPEFNVTAPGHPIWSGIPSSFRTSHKMIYSWIVAFPFGQIKPIALIDLDDLGASAGVIAQDYEGVGRTVQIAHAAHYAKKFDWNQDENITKMMINSIKWVGKLI